jgi:hypothetical protein
MTEDDYIWHNCAGDCACPECEAYREEMGRKEALGSSEGKPSS